MGLDLKFDLENTGENSSGKTFVTKSLYTISNAVYRNHFADELIKQFKI